MVRVKERQIAIVQYLVDVAEQADVLHQLVLLAGFGRVAGLGVQVSQFGHIHGHGHDRDGALVELDGFSVAALIAAKLSQPGQSTIIAGMNVERGEVGIVGCSNIARLRLVFAQFVVEPGEILRGQASFGSSRYRALHQVDCARGIAGDESQIRGAAVAHIDIARLRSRFTGDVEARISNRGSFVLTHIRIGIAHNGKGGEIAGAQGQRFLGIGDGIAEAMLAHAHFRHGGVGGIGRKIRTVEVERLIQRLLRQLKVFHVAGLPGALEKGRAQRRNKQPDLWGCPEPGSAWFDDALGAGGVRNQQRGRHRREHHWRDGWRGYRRFDAVVMLKRWRRGRGGGFRWRVNSTHACPVLHRLRIAGEKFVGTLQHLAGGIQLAHADLDGCDVVGDGGQLAGLAG